MPLPAASALHCFDLAVAVSDLLNPSIGYRYKVFRSENAELLFSDFAAYTTLPGKDAYLE